MAVDPNTVYMAAKMAVKVATDEDSRKKVLAIVLTPVIIMVLLVCCIQYILDTPMRTLQNIFGGASDETYVSGFKEEYGDYNQTISETDDVYIESDGQSYEGIEFTDASIPLVYYNQMDSRWKNILYGQNAGNTIGVAGCGPTSLAMVVSSLTDKIVDPIQASKWASLTGHYVEGQGSKHSVIPDGAIHYGLNVEGAGKDEGQKIVDALKDGKLVVAIMGKGTFTTSGHFIVLRGVTSSGKILVGDPASQRKSGMEWDLSLILREAKGNAGANGPFWLISKPEAIQ